jgi:hypothetical protein
VDLLIVMQKANLTENCLLFNSKGSFISDGIKVILGIKTISPLLFPLTIWASMLYLEV